MAIKGAEAKQNVIQKILDTFEGAFIDNKDIRIPMTENGEPVQIKVTLAAAKTLVEPGSDNAIPGLKVNEKKGEINFGEDTTSTPDLVPTAAIPTKDEKKNIATLLSKLGL